MRRRRGEFSSHTLLSSSSPPSSSPSPSSPSPTTAPGNSSTIKNAKSTKVLRRRRMTKLRMMRGNQEQQIFNIQPHSSSKTITNKNSTTQTKKTFLSSCPATTTITIISCIIITVSPATANSTDPQTQVTALLMFEDSIHICQNKFSYLLFFNFCICLI